MCVGAVGNADGEKAARPRASYQWCASVRRRQFFRAPDPPRPLPDPRLRPHIRNASVHTALSVTSKPAAEDRRSAELLSNIGQREQSFPDSAVCQTCPFPNGLSARVVAHESECWVETQPLAAVAIVQDSHDTSSVLRGTTTVLGKKFPKNNCGKFAIICPNASCAGK